MAWQKSALKEFLFQTYMNQPYHIIVVVVFLKLGFDATEKELRSRQQPNPEPTFKVWDWVEFIDAGGRTSQGKYLSKAYDNAILVRDITYNVRCVVPQQKLSANSPLEIVVRIGCLSGTIAKSCDPNYFLMLHSRPMTDCNHSMIRFSLDTETRSLVESLLKAMRGES